MWSITHYFDVPVKRNCEKPASLDDVTRCAFFQYGKRRCPLCACVEYYHASPRGDVREFTGGDS